MRGSNGRAHEQRPSIERGSKNVLRTEKQGAWCPNDQHIPHQCPAEKSLVTANRSGTGAKPEHTRTQAHGGRDTCRGAEAIGGYFPRTFRAGGTRADGLPRSVRREERLAAANQRHSEAHLSRSVRQRMPVMREMGSEGRRTHQRRIFRPPLLHRKDRNALRGRIEKKRAARGRRTMATVDRC